MGDTEDDNYISPRERELFRQLIGPLDRTRPARRRKSKPLPSARPRSTEADEIEALASLMDDVPDDADVETGDELSYRQTGIQISVMRRLRRGHYRCQAELDLHGMFVSVARQQLAGFLHYAINNDYRCVRIIHGKGLRSGNRGPVLKNKVAHWLRQRQEVLAYVSARQVDGGTGAVYVLLRR